MSGVETVETSAGKQKSPQRRRVTIPLDVKCLKASPYDSEGACVFSMSWCVIISIYLPNFYSSKMCETTR